MDTVRIGIIGIGNMGSSHAKTIDGGRLPKGQLAAVCDINPDRLEWAKENLSESVQRFASADELFAADCVDAIIIATPHYDHPPLAIKGFEHGLHVLSEKPAGVYTKQVREMNEAAAKTDKVFGIMFNQRTTNLYQKVRQLIQDGELGELHRNCWIITNWYRTQSYYDSGGWRATWEGEGGGVLLNQCPHQLDLWQWVCGMPKRVRAFCKFGEYHDIEVDDVVTAYVEYENGASGLFITTTGEAPGTNRFEIVGDRGKIVIEGGQLEFRQNRIPVSQDLKENPQGFRQPENWKIDVPLGRKGEGHLGIMKDWVNAILNGTELLGPGVEGINSLMLSNAMLLSGWLDDWVDLPIDEDLFYEKLQEQVAKSTSTKEAGASKVVDVADTFNA